VCSLTRDPIGHLAIQTCEPVRHFDTGWLRIVVDRIRGEDTQREAQVLIPCPRCLHRSARQRQVHKGQRNGIPVEVIYNTIRDGLTVGQLQTINTSEPLCPIPVPGIPSPSDVFQIIAITITDVDKTFLNYQVTADSGLLQAVNAAAFFANLVAATSQAQPANRFSYSWQIAPSYPGIVNPGSPGGILPQVFIVQAAQELLQSLTVYFNSAVASNVEVQILINGNGIAPILVYKGGSTTPQTVSFSLASSNIRVFAGDLIELYIPTLPSGLTDGIATLVTAVCVN